MTRPSPLSATTPPAPSREQTPLNLRSRPISVPSAAVASQDLPWILLSCRTRACIGRRCRSGKRTASALGRRCGFACAARVSSDLTASSCPNHVRLAPSALGGRHESPSRALGVWTLPLCAFTQAASAGACDPPARRRRCPGWSDRTPHVVH